MSKFSKCLSNWEKIEFGDQNVQNLQNLKMFKMFEISKSLNYLQC